MPNIKTIDNCSTKFENGKYIITTTSTDSDARFSEGNIICWHGTFTYIKEIVANSNSKSAIYEYDSDLTDLNDESIDVYQRYYGAFKAYSHSEGNTCIALGENSHAEGR